MSRVTDRVGRGGHGIPAEVVRRRYQRGLYNFLTLYQPVVRTWRLYDNSERNPVLVAERLEDGLQTIIQPGLWDAVRREAGIR